ncbi:hypothetical protein A8H35_19635 [Burkholderia thailandensis]|nr:hypothetical protein A8H35_19635 [Burkholderia thailandensis]
MPARRGAAARAAAGMSGAARRMAAAVRRCVVAGRWAMRACRAGAGWRSRGRRDARGMCGIGGMRCALRAREAAPRRSDAEAIGGAIGAASDAAATPSAGWSGT